MSAHFVTQQSQFPKDSSVRHEISFLIRLFLFFLPFLFLFSCPLPYITPKWILTLFSLCGAITFFLYHASILYIPPFKRILFYGVCLVALLMCTNSYLHNVPLLSFEHLRRFFFFWSTLFFFNFFHTQGEKEYLKITTMLSLTSAFFVIAALCQYIAYPLSPPYLTFGNINLAAEFVGFSLALQFGTLMKRWKRDEPTLLLSILSALSIAYLYFTFCRSIWIGVLGILIAALVLDRKVIKKIIWIVALSVLFVFCVEFAIELLGHPKGTILKSMSVRWILYLDTLKMILENPWGVGVGQFEFASLPYVSNLFPEHNERSIFLSPHNEFLHFLAEDGLCLSSATLVCIIGLVVSLWAEIKRIFSAHPEFTFFSIILGVQSLFQFPLIDPFPYFLTALMLGYFFSLRTTAPSLSYPLTPPFRYGLLAITCGITAMFFVSFGTRYATRNFPNDERINKVACAYGNRNWQACLNLSVFYGKKGEYAEAEIYARRILQWQPLNFQGIKALGFALLPQGKTREACTLLEQYDGFFQNQSSLHPLIQRECSPGNQ